MRVQEVAVINFNSRRTGEIVHLSETRVDENVQAGGDHRAVDEGHFNLHPLVETALIRVQSQRFEVPRVHPFIADVGGHDHDKQHEPADQGTQLDPKEE